MSELKSCPWCKGTPEVLDCDWGDMTEYRVECLVVDCPVNPSTRHFATEAEAVEAWNTRAERTCQREKHGTKMDGSPRLRCSLCGYGIGDKRFNYCPSCGARVEVDE